MYFKKFYWEKIVKKYSLINLKCFCIFFKFLFAGSILSKKIAEGAHYLIQDVKVGKATFYKDVESAEQLANSMVNKW